MNAWLIKVAIDSKKLKQAKAKEKAERKIYEKLKKKFEGI